VNTVDLIEALAKRARAAGRSLASMDPARMDAALDAIALQLEKHEAAILAANELDVAEAGKNGVSAPMQQRLKLAGKTFASMVEGVRQVRALPNPLGAVLSDITRPNGLKISKVRVPIGTIGIIYESRPNVTVDAGVLCLKTGNAVVLRGGSESFRSNQALAEAMRAGLRDAGLPEDAVQLVSTTDRTAVTALCHQSQYLDLLIPRGGKGLIETVVREARMPVIKHYDGICHLYVHQDADFAMAERVILNAKVQKPGVCNAVETVLIDEAVASTFGPRLVTALRGAKVEVRGDARTQQIGGGDVVAATEEDWRTEYLDLILSVAVVPGLDAAVEHIETYGSHHSDGIITANESAARDFLRKVDSATVYWNASTRFTDGFEFGFGAEIGISTDKIHARGPMGLEELTSYKYVIVGDGQVRS
jgi:glutamate-5-semialdehyde dehydrogenase